MDAKLIIELIFLASSIVTIYLILRRRYLYLRLGMRNIRIDTYFFGALLGPILIVLFGILNVSQILTGLGGTGSLNPFGILVLFLSMVFMSIFLDITGFFEYCATGRPEICEWKRTSTLFFRIPDSLPSDDLYLKRHHYPDIHPIHLLLLKKRRYRPKTIPHRRILRSKHLEHDAVHWESYQHRACCSL